jgi:hypothetical protein
VEVLSLGFAKRTGAQGPCKPFVLSFFADPSFKSFAFTLFQKRGRGGGVEFVDNSPGMIGIQKSIKTKDFI